MLRLVNGIIKWAEQGRPGETGYQFLSFLMNSAFFLLNFGECDTALKYFNIVWPWCLLLQRHIKSVEDGMKQCSDRNISKSLLKKISLFGGRLASQDTSLR